jgi:hypothetical protein
MILTPEQLARVVQLASNGSQHVQDWLPVEIGVIEGMLVVLIPGDPPTAFDLGDHTVKTHQ